MSRNIHPPANFKNEPPTASRRRFLSRAGGTVVALSVIGLPSLSSIAVARAEGETAGRGDERALRAYQLRQQAAQYQRELASSPQAVNGDEELYATRIASYSKALPHNALGEVDIDAYGILVGALKSGHPLAIENIPLGGTVKQANPQAAFAFEMEGTDPHKFSIPPPPAFNSAEIAGEMIELYWQALARDVPFAEYSAHALTQAACADLSKLSNFRGPKADSRVNAAQLFRGSTDGDTSGPYCSQFLWKDVPYGAQTIVQQMHMAVAQLDYLTAYEAWLAIQNGNGTWNNQLDATPRYIHTGRDLAHFVRHDFTYQAFLNACLILLGLKAPLDAGNPYRNSATQSAFCTFGAPHLLDAVVRVANCSLKAAWYQKWLIHRRLRPEEFGGRIHNHWSGAAKYPLPAELLKSAMPSRVFNRFGTYLLPLAYPEGCPTHPAYPSGHAVIAGACATVLKAFFDESFPLPDPVSASADGLSLRPFKGASLTVGGELNKLASNMMMGRNFAGIHWRSDASEGLKLGEAVAISVLSDMKDCYNERFGGFSLTKFDGRTITI